MGGSKIQKLYTLVWGEIEYYHYILSFNNEIQYNRNNKKVFIKYAKLLKCVVFKYYVVVRC